MQQQLRQLPALPITLLRRQYFERVGDVAVVVAGVDVAGVGPQHRQPGTLPHLDSYFHTSPFFVIVHSLQLLLKKVLALNRNLKVSQYRGYT